MTATTRSFHAATPGPVLVDVDLPAGTVEVTVETGRERAEVVVSTPDTTGPAADAVRLAEFQHTGGRLAVRVSAPARSLHHAAAGDAAANVGAIALGGGTVVVGGTAIGSHVQIGSGGVQVNTFGDGQAAAVEQAVVEQAPVTVEVRVPAGSSLDVRGTTTDVETAGDLDTVRVQTVAGSTRLGGVAHARVDTTSGSVEIGRLHGEAWVKTVSGGVEVTADADSRLSARTVSGDIRAVGPIAGDARSVSGRVTTR